MNGTQTTNFEGAAALSQWILGPPGPQTVAATISGIPLVIFNASATPPVPDGLAFDLQDPSLDTSAGTSNRVDPPIYDLLAARGEFIRDTLVMSFTFNVPVAPFTLSPHPTGLDFQISIDTTGTASTHNPNFGVGPFSGPTFSSSHAGNTMTVRVPMPRLAGDDGNLSIVGLFRSADGVVDRFPNQGALLVTRPSGVAANRR